MSEINAERLADILAEEAQQIMATDRSMENERQQIGWRPSKEDRVRLEAIATANHQLVFSLLSIAEKIRNEQHN